jgi:hypothetical protein
MTNYLLKRIKDDSEDYLTSEHDNLFQSFIWQNTHTDQSISEDLLDRVRTRLLAGVVCTVGLETFWAVVENVEADKLF